VIDNSVPGQVAMPGNHEGGTTGLHQVSIVHPMHTLATQQSAGVPAIREFRFEGYRVRVVICPDGEPQFVASDVARILRYHQNGLAVRTFCKGAGETTIPSASGPQITTVIPERDVFRLAVRSGHPEADSFLEWVVSEVLPTIRVADSYQFNPWAPKTLQDSLRSLPQDDPTAKTVSPISELLPVVTQQIGVEEVNAVHARGLHKFLEVGRHFANWIQERVDTYGFLEHQDFEVIIDTDKNPKGGRPSKEYMVSMSMAKELAMMERNAKGKEARLYFIEMEQVALNHLRDQIQHQARPAAPAMSLMEMVAASANALVTIERAKNTMSNQLRTVALDQQALKAQVGRLTSLLVRPPST